MVDNFKLFAQSGLDEAKFYEVSKKNSISIDEYIAIMKDKDFKFNKMAQYEIRLIKAKCNWIRNIYFYVGEKDTESEISLIYFDTTEGRQLLSAKPKGYDKFELSVDVPKFAFFNKDFSNDLARFQDVKTIQTELKEIEGIGFDVYNTELNGRESISGNFKANYRPEVGLLIYSGSTLITAFPREGYRNFKKERFYGQYPVIKTNDNYKIRKKVLIKNNYE